MTKRFREWEVGQGWLLPPTVQDLVPPGHLAHFVRELVRGELDLSQILESYREERGQPPYHPVMMTALLLYTYCQGIYSSRRIARSCQERVDYMAVTAMQAPDFRTISDFRKRHLSALEGLFVQVLQMCQRSGLVTLGHVSLDGTKVRANASKHKAMSYERMSSEEKRLREEVRGWLEKAEDIDGEEDASFGRDRRGDELPDWVKDREKRAQKILEAKEALEREAREEAERLRQEPPRELTPRERAVKKTAEPAPKTQRNFTDPESRILRTGDGFLQGYNCQIAVDAGSQVIVARGVGNRQNDAEQLIGVLEQIRGNLGGSAPCELSADSGYLSEANLKALEEQGVRGYVATGRQRHGKEPPDEARRWNSPWIHAMTARLKRGGYRSRYRLRKQTVEPVFGQIKAARGFLRFSLRGLRKAVGEWSLVCTAHNLRKLANAAI
ncbi:MAG TPA: IS1182 family transposase [Planctomycetota bacterium]